MSATTISLMTLRERKFVRRLRAREEEAFSELVREHQHRVYNVIHRIVLDRAEAEEVAQEVWITIFKKIDSFRGESKLSTWILRIATNHAKNRVKYLSRRANRSHQDIDDTNEKAVHDGHMGERFADPHEAAAGRELEGVIQDALASLNEDHRTLVVLREIDGLSYAEIAEVLDVPEGTVKSRLARARSALNDYVRTHYHR